MLYIVPALPTLFHSSGNYESTFYFCNFDRCRKTYVHIHPHMCTWKCVHSFYKCGEISISLLSHSNLKFLTIYDISSMEIHNAILTPENFAFSNIFMSMFSQCNLIVLVWKIKIQLYIFGESKSKLCLEWYHHSLQ